jgi:tetratricopeptide (TPR) repeat protein
LPDLAQQIAPAESYLKLFNAPGDADLVNHYLINAYTSAKRLDEAFALAATTALDKSPDPVAMMINLPLAGREEVRKGNPKYIAQSKQFALRGIELIESDKKPAAVTDAAWTDYKTQWLPVLYQTIGMLSHASGDYADAKVKITKAAALNPLNPVNYVYIGGMANDEYQRLAQQYKAATGTAQIELLKKAEAQMDEVIDAYAHAIALAEGNAQYDQLRTDLRPDLESYYKHRHNKSTEGLQALIDNYKKPPAIIKPQ